MVLGILDYNEPDSKTQKILTIKQKFAIKILHQNSSKKSKTSNYRKRKTSNYTYVNLKTSNHTSKLKLKA